MSNVLIITTSRYNRKRIAVLLSTVLLLFVLCGCGDSDRNGAAASEVATEKAEENAEVNTDENAEENADRGRTADEAASGKETGEAVAMLQLSIGSENVTVAWEDNETVDALKELVRSEPLTIDMSMYGGFEQVGSVGTDLPRNDVQTTTQAGDIVLYSGNQIVVFYGSNSWAYTRLGHITDKDASELTELLGNGDVTITLTGHGDAQVRGDDVQADVTEGRKQMKVARDGADMQTEDKTMPTRIPMDGGTKINMYFGDTLITGVLNDCKTARALIEKLPITQHVNRYSHDFCGITEELPYDEDEVHFGWLNGDIDYAINAPYFTILFEDEESSEQYGDQVNIGVITSPLSEIVALEGSYEVRIELAE